jgi:hypothetical protein
MARTTFVESGSPQQNHFPSPSRRPSLTPFRKRGIEPLGRTNLPIQFQFNA